MSLAPQLEKIAVDPGKLLLNPNNPRLFSQEFEKIPLENIQDPGVQDKTMSRVDSDDDDYKIEALVQSILSAGYVPEAGGYMFVRALANKDYYVVLEGNRRLTAIRKILRDRDRYQMEHFEVLQSLSQIEVQEITDDIPEEELQKKISYILGTVHHGSHKNWSPFAQAKEIYSTYIDIVGQDWDTFNYAKERGINIASLLNTDEKSVKERLSVYRAMKQLSETPEMKAIKPNGGIIDEYYSLIKEAVCATKQKLKEYIQCHPDTLLLEEEAIERMLNLCQFNGGKRRDDSPMNTPQQWRSLNKILEDGDEEKRSKNLTLVEEQHEKPDEVYAVRAEELRRLNWKKWLELTHAILKDVPMGEDWDINGSHQAIETVDNILKSLGSNGGN